MKLVNGLVHQESPSIVAQFLEVPITPLTHLQKVKDTIPVRNADFILSHSHDKMNISLFLGHHLVVKLVKPVGHKLVGVAKPVKPVGHAFILTFFAFSYVFYSNVLLFQACCTFHHTLIRICVAICSTHRIIIQSTSNVAFAFH